PGRRRRVRHRGRQSLAGGELVPPQQERGDRAPVPLPGPVRAVPAGAAALVRAGVHAALSRLLHRHARSPPLPHRVPTPSCRPVPPPSWPPGPPPPCLASSTATPEARLSRTAFPRHPAARGNSPATTANCALPRALLVRQVWSARVNSEAPR